MEEDGVPKLESKVEDPNATPSIKEHLRQLLHSLLANTFQLLRFMEVCPSRVGEKVADVNLIIVNMLYTLNSLRRNQCLQNIMDYINQKVEHRTEYAEKLKGVMRELKTELDSIADEKKK